VKAERAIAEERLPGADSAAARANLRDLDRINRWLGGYRVARRLIRLATRDLDRFTLLDVGAADGALSRAIAVRFRGARVTALDRAQAHLVAGSGTRVAADAFSLPFRPGSFDVVFCSLFLHHFDTPRIVELLRAFGGIARRAVIAIDLERRWLAHRFVPATGWLFGWTPVTLHDAPVSVQAGFRLPELERLAREAGFPFARVRRHPPWFRLSMTIVREPLAADARPRRVLKHA